MTGGLQRHYKSGGCLSAAPRVARTPRGWRKRARRAIQDDYALLTPRERHDLELRTGVDRFLSFLLGRFGYGRRFA